MRPRKAQNIFHTVPDAAESRTITVRLLTLLLTVCLELQQKCISLSFSFLVVGG